MANANPSKMHGDDSHDGIPTPAEKPQEQKVIKLLDVSGKAVKLVGEQKLACGTVRRDYA